MEAEVKRMYDEIEWLQTTPAPTLSTYAEWVMKSDGCSYYEATDEVRRKGSLPKFSDWVKWRIDVLHKIIKEYGAL